MRAAILIGCILLVILPAASIQAEDAVIISSSSAGSLRLTGEVLDYSGSGLRLRRASGREETIDADRVLEVQTTWPEAAAAAEKLVEAGDLAAAVPLYRQAMAAEKRRWAQRALAAQLVRCYRDLRRTAEAAEIFLLLLQEDPATPYLHAMPLNWTGGELAPDLEQRARQWLTSETAAEQLMGASWLLSGSAQGTAPATLRGLTANQDQRIAWLAEAQLWRIERVQATPATIERWQARLAQMPPALRAGPQFTVAQALAQQQQAAKAALAWMHVPILYNGSRELSAEALYEAARQLEKLEQHEQAVTLYREVVSDYRGSSAAALAERHLLHVARHSVP